MELLYDPGMDNYAIRHICIYGQVAERMRRRLQEKGLIPDDESEPDESEPDEPEVYALIRAAEAPPIRVGDDEGWDLVRGLCWTPNTEGGFDAERTRQAIRSDDSYRERVGAFLSRKIGELFDLAPQLHQVGREKMYQMVAFGRGWFTALSDNPGIGDDLQNLVRGESLLRMLTR